MRRLLALLLLATPAAAQLAVGSASLTFGDEVVYSGGPSQPPESKQTGLMIQLNASVARFSRDSCFGTQARLERALVEAARDGKLPVGARVEDATLDALVAGKYLKARPSDPEVTHGYSWWNYQRGYDGKISCRSHGDFRKAPPEEPTED
jgi:hypothetical protein